MCLTLHGAAERAWPACGEHHSGHVLQESRTYWFNPATLEPEDEFMLIGLVLGLAIYNAVILDFPLPLALYKKLLGQQTTLRDLQDMDPTLGKSLQQLLAYEGEPRPGIGHSRLMQCDWDAAGVAACSWCYPRKWRVWRLTHGIWLQPCLPVSCQGVGAFAAAPCSPAFCVAGLSLKVPARR